MNNKKPPMKFKDLSPLEQLQKELKSLNSRKKWLEKRQSSLDKLTPPASLYKSICDGPRFLSTYSRYAALDPTYLTLEWGPENFEPKFTNYTEKFKSTLDYIFLVEETINSLNYNPPCKRELECEDTPRVMRLVPIQFMALPPPDTLGVGLPNLNHPSDHLPLMTRFRYVL